MQQRDRLFRKVALERLSTPERLDELMQVTTPKGWLGLLALCGVIAAAVIWGLHGSVPTTVTGQGILIKEGSIQTVESPASGQLTDIYVSVGDHVREDQVVARVFQQGDASREGGSSRTIVVTSPYVGRVLEVRVIRGNVIQAGAGLLSVELPGRSLEGILYLPPVDGKKVRPGMGVQISPAAVKREEYGMMLGRVTTVGEFPVSQAAMRRVLGSDELVKALSASGAPIEIHVRLLRSPTTASGYQWTSTLSSTVPTLLVSVSSAVGSTLDGLSSAVASALPAEWTAGMPTAWFFEPPPEWTTEWTTPKGPPITVESGTPCQATVIIEEQAPIYLVLARFNQPNR